MGKIAVVSACLIGIPCAYDGKGRISRPLLEKLIGYHAVVAICPEVLGGLKVPREKAEIVGGDGEAVLLGKAKVVNEKGDDITKYYLKGALRAIEIVKNAEAEEAFLREWSPACAVLEIYDGTFTGKKIKGKGVFSALLEKEKIKIEGVKEF